MHGRWLDRWIIEALICAEVIAIANVIVMASAIYALEYVARRIEHRVSGRRVRPVVVDRSPYSQPNPKGDRRVPTIARGVGS